MQDGPTEYYVAERYCNGCQLDVGFLRRVEDNEADTCGCCRNGSRQWWRCPRCPDLDFCTECRSQHEHNTVPGPMHPQARVCIACTSELLVDSQDNNA